MKRNILIVFHNPQDNGGAENVLQQIAFEYVRQGDIVYILFFYSRKDFRSIEIINSAHYVLYGYSGILKLRKVKFDYAYSSLIKCTFGIGVLRRMRFLQIKKFVGRESTSFFVRFSGIKRIIIRFMYKIGYKAVDLLICQTDFMRHQLLDNMPEIERYSKVVVLPNPVSLEHMNELGMMNISEVRMNAPYIVSAGRMINEKGFDILINAFIKFRQIHPDFKLLLLGDGSLRKNFEDQVRTLGAEDHILFYGMQANVFPYFRNARMCVVSSRIEGFPNVLLQMMSQNNNIVSTLCADGIEKIIGVYPCTPDDEQSLYKAMCQCVNVDNSNFRNSFDQELSARSIVNFVKGMERI